jgi:hypothetical protein
MDPSGSVGKSSGKGGSSNIFRLIRKIGKKRFILIHSPVYDGGRSRKKPWAIAVLNSTVPIGSMLRLFEVNVKYHINLHPDIFTKQQHTRVLVISESFSPPLLISTLNLG